LKHLKGRFLVILGLFLGLSSFAFAQNTSNKGTDFWVAYAGHIDAKLSRMTLFLSSDVNTTYKVEGLGQTIASGNITANVITSVFIDPNVVDVHIASSDLVEINKGIHVTSGNPISVYSVISNSARTGGSLILPTKSLGREYYAFSYQNAGGSQGGNAKSEFTILAVEDDTEIEITPTVTSTNGVRTANTTYKITQKLNKGDIYQFQSVNDVSGSIIKTLGNCKPIAVFSGNTWAAFCEDGNTLTNPNVSITGKPTPSGGDNLFQQLFPVSAWGKNFVTAPFYNTENGNTDAIRIIVSEDNTNITINGSATLAFGTTLANPYKKGSIITYFTRTPSIIKADKPVGVAQYQSAQNCNPANKPNVTVPGDPEMTILNPIEQTLSDITVFSKLISVAGVKTNINKYFLNIILKTVDAPTLKVDGLAVTGFKTIDTEYSYVIIDVSSSQDQHRIVAAGGFVAIAYGYGTVESYAYLAGSDVKNLFQNITANTQANKLISTGCVSEPPKFILKLPYQSSSIVWNLDDGKGSFTDSAPLFTTSLIDGRTIYSYLYPKADPLYTTAGKHLITAVVINPNPSGCNGLEVVSLEFEIVNKPTAVFTASSQACTDASITFTDASLGNGKSITKWLWDFGDGKLSTDRNPVHTYTASGDYIVKLIVEGETECKSDVVTQNVHIIALPLVNFNIGVLACETKDVLFTDISSTAEGNIVKWIWNFGDGTAIEEKTSSTPFAHKYAVAGSYKVTLKVLTDKGCESVVFEKTVLINPLPIVKFGVPETCIAEIFAQFTDSSSISDGKALSYLWNFGNPSSGALNTSTLKNPTHKYTVAGDYLVSLTVTSESGCFNSVVKTFKVSGAVPKANFLVLNSTNLCSNQEVVFRNTSTVDFGTIGKVEWFFDYGGDLSLKLVDENPVPGKEYRFLYPMFSSPASKQFIVRMVAYSGGVCSDDEIQTIVLKPLPIANFEVPDFCLADGSAQFSNTTTISDGTEVQLTYLWDFGDALANSQRPNTSTLKNAAHRYTKAGRYTVKLTVKSINDCVNTISKLFVVNGGVPKADFIVKNPGLLCSDKPVEFEDNVKVELDEEITKIEWIYDLVNFPNAIEIDDTPAMRASASRIYTHKYPAFTSPASKTYTVKMLAYTGGACVHTITKTITVLAVPLVDFELPSSCLINGIASFKDKSSIAGTNGPFTYLWDFGDKNASANKPNTSTEKDPKHNYSMAGDYIVKLIVTSQAGCSTTFSKTLTVAGSIPIAAFTVLTPDKLCSDAGVVFEDRTTIDFGEITKIEWYYDYGNNPSLKFTDDNTAKRSDPPKQYSYTYPVFFTPATKTVTVKMVAFSGTTCMDEELQTITLHAVPRVLFDSIPAICSDAKPIQLTQAKEIHGVLTGTGTYSGKGVTPTGLFNQAITGLGTHTLTYTFVADNGCTDFKTQTITVNEIPTATIIPKKFVLDGGMIKLPAAATGNNLTYKWTPALYLDKDDILNPETTPTDDITYTLTVTTDKGCTASTEIFIKVLKFPEVPNSFTPNGDGVNDTWNVKHLESYPNATVHIFNRYGEKLFQTVNYLTPWDGTKNGSDLPFGTYYYIINPQNGRKIISGSVTILR
jgi:gliding motility-associated-like protein